MKNITTALILLIGTIGVKSQVAMGKPSVTNASVSLEFADTENRGLILPYIVDKSSMAENGTIIYDASDKKVKYLKDIATNTWFDLTVDTTGVVDLSLQGLDKVEKTTAKTAIGSNAATDSVDGILVLTDTNKAMVLPRVASPHLNILNPSAGMMVYDLTKKQLAVYNGTMWSFWKP